MSYGRVRVSQWTREGIREALKIVKGWLARDARAMLPGEEQRFLPTYRPVVKGVEYIVPSDGILEESGLIKTEGFEVVCNFHCYYYRKPKEGENVQPVQPS